jgi:plasmid stability protein
MDAQLLMTNLTIKNVPNSLYQRLKEMAARNHRSLNSEVIVRLERSLATAPLDTEALLARARSIRERAELPYLSEAALREARDEGRS